VNVGSDEAEAVLTGQTEYFFDSSYIAMSKFPITFTEGGFLKAIRLCSTSEASIKRFNCNAAFAWLSHYSASAPLRGQENRI